MQEFLELPRLFVHFTLFRTVLIIIVSKIVISRLQNRFALQSLDILQRFKLCLLIRNLPKVQLLHKEVFNLVLLVGGMVHAAYRNRPEQKHELVEQKTRLVSMWLASCLLRTVVFIVNPLEHLLRNQVLLLFRRLGWNDFRNANDKRLNIEQVGHQVFDTAQL